MAHELASGFRSVLALSLAFTSFACAEGTSLTGGGGSGSGLAPTTGGGGSSSDGGAATGGGGEATGGTPTFGGMGGTGGSLPEEKCGNGALDPGEPCDGADLNDATCASIGQGFVDGTLSCAACAFDTSGCNAPPNCGNGSLDAGEQCDGSNLDGHSCASEGFVAGSISCGGGCQLDLSACYACGNGTIEGPELCDGVNLAGASCQSLGHDGGTLTCTPNCLALNEAPCTDCGDAVVEGVEQCDGNNLNGQTCQTQGFLGGSLSCTAACAFNFGACTGQTCGNGVREGTEVCDGAALNGQTCISQGFIGGTLSCNGTCTAYVTSGCTGSQCQDATDNDGDGFVDLLDPGCSSAADNDEFVYAANCNGIGGTIYDISDASGQDFTITGTTAGQPAVLVPTDFFDDCTTNSASEVVLFYRNFSQKNGVIFSLDTLGTNFDTVLYIRQSTCSQSAAVELCNDDNFFGLQSELVVDLPPGDYFIVVDGYGGQSGPFELSVDFP